MATYNLVSSIKGGCGKTTFSIWLAYYLDQSLLIDMDLLGTSLQIVFDGNVDDRKMAYTNDVFHEVKNNTKRFVDRVMFENNSSINVIFSSMDYKEREKFKSGKSSGYTPVVKHSIFRLGIRNLIRYNKTLDGETIKHFIFDMPPNSDGFSDAAMECVFNPKYSDLEDNDRKNLFMMIGADWGQTIATIYELRSMLLHSDEIEPDGIFLVLNHNQGSNFEDIHYNLRKREIEIALDNCKLSESIKEKIFFLKMPHNDNYTKLGIEGTGLRNAHADEIENAFLAAVVSGVAKYGQDDFEKIQDDLDGENRLRKLILGESNEENEEA